MKLHIYINDPERFLKGEYESCFSTSLRDDWNIDGWVYAGEVDLDIEVNELDVRGTALTALDNRIKEIRATSEAGIMEIQERKQNLMALEAL